MESRPTLQQTFFQQLKSLVPAHLSLVDVVAELLNISTDSAYRRIRSEKPLTIDETVKLASHFHLSIDKLYENGSGSFLFGGNLTNATDHVFEKWMEGTLQQLQYMNSFENKHLYYIAKDIPLMQQFFSPELTAFKSFFWRKSILHYEDLRGVKFSLQNINAYHLELAGKIVAVYNQIPSTDVWNIESINTTIRQIEFYRSANVFDTTEDLRLLYDSVCRLVNHIEKQAEYGKKFTVNASPLLPGEAFNLFNNELILGDNTVFAELNNTKLAFLNHSVINFIWTKDERFCAHMADAIQNIMKKSTQLSVVGEKERTRFFNRVREKIRQAAKL